MAKSDHRKGKLNYPFIALPTGVVRSAVWQALPPSAVKLAIDLMAQYTGKNNGRLTPAFEAMERCGWKSKTTLIAAKRALLQCDFVVLTRKGHPPRTAEWVAFTWWTLDFEKSMEIDPRKFPLYAGMEISGIDHNKLPPKTLSVVQNLDSLNQKIAPGGIETGLWRSI